MVAKDLVPNAIEEYLVKYQLKSEIYWDRIEYLSKTEESQLEYFGDVYLTLRGKGKELYEIGKRLYEKGEKMRLPGFEKVYYKYDNT